MLGLFLGVGGWSDLQGAALTRLKPLFDEIFN